MKLVCLLLTNRLQHCGNRFYQMNQMFVQCNTLPYQITQSKFICVSICISLSIISSAIIQTHTVRHIHSHGKNSVEGIIIQNNVMNYKWMRKTTNTSVYIEMKRRYNCICAYGSVTERKYTFIVLLSFKWILKQHTKNAKRNELT